MKMNKELLKMKERVDNQCNSSLFTGEMLKKDNTRFKIWDKDINEVLSKEEIDKCIIEPFSLINPKRWQDLNMLLYYSNIYYWQMTQKEIMDEIKDKTKFKANTKFNLEDCIIALKLFYESNDDKNKNLKILSFEEFEKNINQLPKLVEQYTIKEIMFFTKKHLDKIEYNETFEELIELAADANAFSDIWKPSPIRLFFFGNDEHLFDVIIGEI